MRAEDRVIAEPAGDAQGLRVAVALGQLADLLDGNAERRGQRLDRLPAADIRAGGHVLDPVPLQLVDEASRLAHAFWAQWALIVGPGPTLAVAGVRMADYEHFQTFIQSRNLRLRAAFQTCGQAARAFAAADRSAAISS